MIDKYFIGILPAPGVEEPIDREIPALALRITEDYKILVEEMRFHEALAAVWKLLRRANKYIDETSPWDLAKREQDRSRLGMVLYNVVEVLRIATIAVKPFLIEAAENSGTDWVWPILSGRR